MHYKSSIYQADWDNSPGRKPPLRMKYLPLHLSHLCFLPKKVDLSLFLALFSFKSSSVIGSVFLLF